MKLLRVVFLAAITLAVLILSGGTSVEASTPIDVGYFDFSWSGNLGNNEVTAEKPESKIWWNDGYWWASMWSGTSSAYNIFKLDWATQNWADTGTSIDDRPGSRADALWDGSKLYVVSHIWSGDGSSASAGQRGELYKYSYSSGSYTLDTGFPVEVNQGNSEALVIDKDTTGLLWITWVQDQKVYVSHSTAGNDASWVAPYMLPVTGADNLDSDDLSTLIAYDGHIGIMWSNQVSGGVYFAAHADGDDDQTWQSVGAYTISQDDHFNLKKLSSDGAGKIFAAAKTSKSAALIILLVCDGGNCTSASNWSAHTVYTGAGTASPTRPALVLDPGNRDIYLFARVKDGVDEAIYYKRSDMDNISFPSGLGDPFIKGSSYKLNDPSTTKQNVSNVSGLVVIASSSSEKAYVHNCMRLAGGTSSQCIATNPTPSVYFTSAAYTVSEDGAPTAEVTVELSGSVSGDVTVDYATTDGDATDGLDYTASSGKLTFPSGNAGTQTIYVPILEDSETELPETINLTLSNLSGTGVELGTPNSAILTIIDDDVSPEINFSSASYNVVENQIKATIEVVLSNSFDENVTVEYETANGTAIAGSDYEAILPTTLTFAPGEVSKTFDVMLINDNVIETQKTVQLNLSSPSANAFLGTQSSSILTITDDDGPLEVAFESATYSVLENEGPAVINVLLSRPYGTEVSVYYQTSAGGTATPGSDYTAIPLTQLIFEPGVTQKTINVAINNNDVGETPETVLLDLSNPSVDATLGVQSSTTLTILDDDIPPEINFSSATYSVNEDSASTLVNVTLTHTFSSTVTVTYQTTDGTANAGSDYTAIPPTVLTFDPGQTNKTFFVLIDDDAEPEPAETLQLSLSNASPNAVLGAQKLATLTILDNDTVPTIMFDSATYEFDEAAGDVLVTVNLDTASGQTVRVNYETSDGTGESGKDYVSASDVLIFSPGQTTGEISLSILDDTLEEDNEYFDLTLSNPQNGELGAPGSAKITIVDDDLPPTVNFDKSSYEVKENQGQVLITALLSRPVGQEVRVDYATSDGTATADSDYESVSGTLIFPPYQTSKNFTVKIKNDSENEQDETVNVSLNNASTTLLSIDANAILTIIDDDRPDVQFKYGSYVKYGAGTAVVEVVLSEPAESNVVVNYATSDGTAHAGIDYAATSGTLIFGTGTTTRTFAVPILKDENGPTGKTINLNLSGSQLADMGTPDSAVLTIMRKQFTFLPFIKTRQ